jgi:amino acid transporter
LQVLVLVGFVILAVFALYSGKGNGALTLKPLFDPAAFNAGRVFGATSICVMSFLGFDAVSTLAEEVKGGDRHVVGRAIIAVLMLSAVFFVTVTWVLGNLLPGIAIKDSAAATYELAAWAIGPWMAAVLAWTNAVVVGLSNALPMQVGVARVVFAMGRDRQMPHAFARVHPRYRTPYVGMLVTSVISLGVGLVMEYRLDDLASIVNFGALSGFLLLHTAVLVRFAIKQRSRRIVAHWIVPICGFVVVLAVFTGMSGLAAKVGLTWLAAGLIYGAVLKVKNREELRAPL